MTYRLIALCLLAAAMFTASAAQTRAPVQRILFGSCGHQDKDMPILDAIISDQPDLFIFLGDNIYGDTQDMEVLAEKYALLGAKSRFQSLQKSAEVIAIWDDHDYGENDAGAEYPQKEGSRKLMLDFWKEPENSPRRTRPDGIYTSYVYGEKGQRVQVILPDLRWNRPQIEEVSTLEYLLKRKPDNLGPYSRHPDPEASMLGEAQWRWFEEQLKVPADVRIIGSSLQVLADFTGWEAWENFPADVDRLKKLITKHRVNGVILISGDTHWGEISKVSKGLDYPLWDITSSGLTQEWKNVSPNENRVGDFTSQVNYGAIEIDWQKSDPLIRFGLHDVKGDIVIQHTVTLSSLSPY